MVKKATREYMPIPIDTTKILEEYVDIIPNELPDGQPPKRDI